MTAVVAFAFYNQIMETEVIGYTEDRTEPLNSLWRVGWDEFAKYTSQHPQLVDLFNTRVFPMALT
jgi:hypothetical protein